MVSSRKMTKDSKELDAWSERFIFAPLGSLLLPLLKNLKINPLVITLTSLVFGLASAFFILKQSFYLAGIFYFISVLLDNVDGRLARVINRETQLRKTIDQLVDQIVLIFIMIALSVTIGKTIFFLIIVSLLFIYEVSFALRMIIRLESKIQSSSMGETLKSYSDVLLHRTKSTIISRFVNIHNKLLKTSRKIGTWPYPKLADIHFLLFLYILFRSDIFLLLCIIVILIELLLSSILTIILSMRGS